MPGSHVKLVTEGSAAPARWGRGRRSGTLCTQALQSWLEGSLGSYKPEEGQAGGGHTEGLPPAPCSPAGVQQAAYPVLSWGRHKEKRLGWKRVAQRGS